MSLLIHTRGMTIISVGSECNLLAMCKIPWEGKALRGHVRQPVGTTVPIAPQSNMIGVHRFFRSLLGAILCVWLPINSSLLLTAGRAEMTKRAQAGLPCGVAPLLEWTPQEQWVWQRVCAGEKADLAQAKDNGEALDPSNTEVWPNERKLRSEFLETILLLEPFRSALPRQGVRIIGAWFTEPLDLSFATINRQLWLDGSRFDQILDLSYLTISSVLSLEGSTFHNAVILLRAEINGLLNMNYTTFEDRLILDTAVVGATLLMNGVTASGEVDLHGMKIGRTLEIGGGLFTGSLLIESAEIESHLFMQGTEVNTSGPLGLNFAEIKGNLDLSGSFLPSVNLTGTRVHGELQLYDRIYGEAEERSSEAEWQEGARLILRNSEVGTLPDLSEAWPEEVELNGFKYAYLGGLGSDGAESIHQAGIGLFTKWLERQKRFSRQPYEQLANVLRSAGYESEAKQILYASWAREHSETTSWLSWIWLTLKWLFIGYGYAIHYSLYWIVVLIILGVTVLRVSGQSAAMGMRYYGIAYSVDMLLPVIELRKHHSDIDLDGWVRGYFYIHKVFGYVLASFLIAGLSGLTK